MKSRVSVWILLVCFPALLLPGCLPRQEGEARPSTPVSPPRDPGSSGAAAVREPPVRSSRRAPAAEQPASPPAPVRAFSWKEDPLFGPPGNFITPQDFSLGELATGGEASREIREAEELFYRFFTRLARKELPEAEILPAYRPLLLRMLEEYIAREQGFSTVRIGRLQISREEPETALAPVLLLGNPGRARGDIAADRWEGAWYVSGLFIDFSDLDRPRESLPPGSFDPGLSGSPF